MVSWFKKAWLDDWEAHKLTFSASSQVKHKHLWYVCVCFPRWNHLVVFDGVVAEALPLSEALWDLLCVTIWVDTRVKGQVPLYLCEGRRAVHVGLPRRAALPGTVASLVIDRACRRQHWLIKFLDPAKTAGEDSGLEREQESSPWCHLSEWTSQLHGPRPTFENKRWLGNVLVLQQNVDVKLRVGGVHSVADQEWAIPTIQDLDPNPGELLHRRHNLYFKGFLTRWCSQTVGGGRIQRYLLLLRRTASHLITTNTSRCLQSSGLNLCQFIIVWFISALTHSLYSLHTRRFKVCVSQKTSVPWWSPNRCVWVTWIVTQSNNLCTVFYGWVHFLHSQCVCTSSRCSNDCSRHDHHREEAPLISSCNCVMKKVIGGRLTSSCLWFVCHICPHRSKLQI